jgi:hypothetical protein
VPAGGGSSPPHSGGPGIMPAGTMTGAWGASLDWDRRGRVFAPGKPRKVSAPRLGRPYRTARARCVPGSLARD